MNNEAAGSGLEKKGILICDTQPVAVEGMKWLIENSGDLRFAGSVHSLDRVYEALHPAAAEMASETPDFALDERDLQTAGAETSLLTAAIPGEIPQPAIDELEKEAFASDLCAISEALESWAEPGNTEPSRAIAEAPPAIAGPVDAVVIDKGLGFSGVMELLQKLASTSHAIPAIVWGSAITESEALRLLQAGARGIVRRTSESGRLLDCLRAVTSGGTWMEEGIFGSAEKLFNPRRSQLTSREREVVVLVEKGMRNRDIAKVLGIQTGTVKIHLKHIFEKTGVRGRYGLAFTGLQSRGSIAVAAPQPVTV